MKWAITLISAFLGFLSAGNPSIKILRDFQKSLVTTYIHLKWTYIADLERRSGGRHDLVERFPRMLFGRSEGGEQVVEAEQRQQQQCGSESLE